MIPRPFAGALLLLALAGCEEAPAPYACGFEATHVHARAEGGRFDDVELVPHGDGARLVWSDRSGLHVARLDAEGRPRGAARIATACPGGVGAAPRGEALVVACLRPGDRDRGRGGELVLLSVGEEGARALGTLPGIGAESRGVALAIEGERVVAGYRDADELTGRARIAELADGALAPRELSSEGVLASAPSLVFERGALVAAWTESWFDPDGRPAGHLFVQREGEPPRPSLEVGDVDVHVRIARDERGLLVTLRDRRPRGAEHRSFVGRLDDRLRLTLGALRSPGRANAPDSEPMLVPCGGDVFSVSTRTSSREVTMVSLRRLDAELRPVENEQQIYEYHARFPQAVGACVGGQLLLAVGERGSASSPAPRLRTYDMRCGDGVIHERTPGTEGQVLGERGR